MRRGMGAGMRRGGGRGMGMGGGCGSGRGMGMGKGTGNRMPIQLSQEISATQQPLKFENDVLKRGKTIEASKRQSETFQKDFNSRNLEIQKFESVNTEIELKAYINPIWCNRCGNCVSICPKSAITLAKGIMNVDNTKCIGCGQCMRQCPHNAITLRSK